MLQDQIGNPFKFNGHKCFSKGLRANGKKNEKIDLVEWKSPRKALDWKELVALKSCAAS